MSYPRLGTPAGDRAVASAQRSYDNMTPDEDEDEPEEETERVVCSGSCEACGDCEHAQEHDKGDACFLANCVGAGREVRCEEV